MPKLPKNLPALPPVPEGYSRWEYKGKAWNSGDKPVGAPWAVGETGRSWVVLPEQWRFGFRNGHYIVAVRDPKPAPKKRERRVVAIKGVSTLTPTTFGIISVFPETKDTYLTPVVLLPADAASVARMQDQAYYAVVAETDLPADACERIARAALAAIGISAKGGRK